MSELVLTGVGVGTAAVVGPVARMADTSAEPAEPADTPAGGDPEAERRTALDALATVAAELRRRGTHAGGDAAEVLEAQAMMAEDPTLAEGITARTAAGRGAARAVFETFGEFRATLAAAGEYLAARVADLDDIAARTIAVALGEPMPGVPSSDRPFVLVARDLAPADTALLDLDTVLALVTAEGGPTSHTAILSRSRGIPAVVGAAGCLELAEGTEVAVDAAAGTVTARPSAATVTAVHQRAEAHEHVPAGPGSTRDGHAVRLLANIGGPEDLPAALAAGAEGIGLFRTEFLYLDATEPPSAATQTAVYRDVLGAFPGGHVVVRTLDAGADKPLAFLDQPAEPNPALGVRGLRAFHDAPELLDAQLAALAAAAAELGRLGAHPWVMAPMVADAEEAAWFVARARRHGLGHAGVMIEVPAAALTADAVLRVADFASIGTNDLTQYTLAADRLLGRLAARQDPWHPGVLRLIGAAGEAGERQGRPVGVCGEAAADPLLAPVLVGLGATSLSMAPAAIADVRDALVAVDRGACRRAARAACDAATAAEARTAAREALAG